MKTIGLIGGMSWESSAEYYRIVNRRIRDRFGPTASARCILWSFDFAEIAALQRSGDWNALEARMVDAARRLEAAGADMVLICTNTMHRMADAVQAAISVPLIHIVEPVAQAIRAAGRDGSGCSAPPSRWSRASTPIAWRRTASRRSCTMPPIVPTCIASSMTNYAPDGSRLHRVTPIAR